MSWAPIEGDHSYAKNSAVVAVNYTTKQVTVVTNYTIKQVVATPHILAGTPGTGHNRTGT